MNFDVYFPFKNKKGELFPGIKAKPMNWEDIKKVMASERVCNLIDRIREADKAGDKDLKASLKKQLPSVCWTGRSKTGKRLDEDMEATQFVMVDIDHCKDAVWAYENIAASLATDDELFGSVLIIHFTPSMGLRIVFRAIKDYPTLKEHMEWLRDKMDLTRYGDFDSAVKNLSRVSFVTKLNDVKYVNEKLMNDEIKFEIDPIKSDVFQGEEKEDLGEATRPQEGHLFDNTSVQDFTQEEIERFDKFDYRGTPVKLIVDKYVEVMGTPSSGEIHNYFNEMVKNFRCICDNNKRYLLYVLPRFGHTIDECWSQIVSITRVNTLSRLPKNFYFFLKDNGFYEPRGQRTDDLMSFMLSENEEIKDKPPYAPPVFREFINSAPIDFVLPCIDALLPIMGTLTSYLEAEYPYDARPHTTSFFTVIYAPPGTGKGFVERFIDLLFEDLKLRDFVQSERENVYLRVLQRRGANDQVPDAPHTSLRLIPPKNSEAEFLQKQRDNQGYHMFTYAAEMDSWAKGVRAAGGNKDDMIRIAWDNGEYGQQFKSFNTFKGSVRLYWNVLITGTIAQVESYFKNVENGLVTRCSFTSIDNQEFAEAPVWKKINKRGMDAIKAFMKRCDLNTYETPCSIDITDLLNVSDKDFDTEVDWRFKFRQRKRVNMDWLMPTIEKFHKEQVAKAALDVDRARDVFRRRVAVRGFRLGIMCYALWEKPRESDLKKCCSFIWWWMHKDLDSILKLWGSKYNEATDIAPKIVQRTVYDSLGDHFTRTDVYTVCAKQGIKTPVRRIVFDWKRLGYIKQQDKEHFEKKKK